jgi:hypothetical protein
MKKRILAICNVIGCLLVMFLFSGSAAAASIQLYGLSVTPALEQLTIASGQQTASFSCAITNNTNATLDLTMTAQDFTALNNTGGVSFLTNSSPSNSNGLADWIKFGVHTAVLPAHSSQVIPVTIVNAVNLAPGGHYAALKFTAAMPNSTTSTNRILTQEVVTTLLFVIASGHAVQTIKLEPLQQSWLSLHIPSNAYLVFSNAGNTQTAPRGLVTIESPFHSEVARGIVNAGSGLVLPATSRLYNVPLRAEGSFNFPGIYTVIVHYGPNGTPSTQTITKHFLYINEPLFIAVVVMIIIAILWLLRRYGLRQIYIMRHKA